MRYTTIPTTRPAATWETAVYRVRPRRINTAPMSDTLPGAFAIGYQHQDYNTIISPLQHKPQRDRRTAGSVR